MFPPAHPHLGWVGDHLSRVVQNRVLHAKIDEFALVTCGSRETNNDVHTEGLENATAAGETDYEQEYLNVSVDAPMSCAAPELAEAVADLPLSPGRRRRGLPRRPHRRVRRARASRARRRVPAPHPLRHRSSHALCGGRRLSRRDGRGHARCGVQLVVAVASSSATTTRFAPIAPCSSACARN